MPTASITTGDIFEDGGATFMARVVGNNASNITQATITGISYKVFDLTNLPGSEVASGTLTVSSVVFDTLQTDSRWTKDSTGYNFRHAMPASAFASGGRIYQVEYLFDPSSGENFFVVFKVTAKEVFSS